MKRRRSLLICLAILALLFVACNGAEEATQGSVAVRTPEVGTVVPPPEEPTESSEPPSTPEPIPSSTPTPTVPQGPALVVTGGHTYVVGDYFYVVGQVENNTDDWLESVKIVATYYDQAGVTVGSAFTYTTLDQVPPRGVGVFSLGVDMSTLSGRRLGFQLVAQGSPTNPTADDEGSGFCCPGLEVSVFNEYESGGYHHLEGTVENKGPADCEFVKVVAGFYDGSGGVVGSGFTYTEMNVVPAGGRSPFDLAAGNVPGYDHYQVWVQGRPLQ
jgi:hypothetical protein